MVACIVLLGACSSKPPKPVQPPLQILAQELEAEGIKKFAHGDFSGALQRFTQAQKLQQSMDNAAGVARNQLHQAHAELALGQAQAALTRASTIANAAVQADTLLLQAQANLDLGQVAQAKGHLLELDRICSTDCSSLGSLRLLQTRVALAEKQPKEAIARANQALQSLQERNEPRELGNAWRLLATAQLSAGDTAGALKAAQTALNIDRELALPEKIARDWILVGDIQRRAGMLEAAGSYQRALAVAQAAGLSDLVNMANQAFKGSSP